jgi:uncharacterized protein YcnI
MRSSLLLATAIAGLPFLATAALAHVTIAVKEAPIGADYRAVFRVPHGCKGSATVALSVQIPEGVLGVKPQPKPGWTIDILEGAYEHAYQRFASQVTAGVKSVTWSGGKLPDDYYDEFVLIGYLDKSLTPGKSLYFPVTQTCEQGDARWTEIPEAGKSAHDYKNPAPAVKLLPAEAAE